jgi:small subunit ribosomal protein S7
MRSKVKIRKSTKADIVYNSVEVEKFINYIMQEGKKNTARKIVYNAFDRIKKDTKKEPMEVFENAIRNVAPLVEVKSRRVGGANYQVPQEVRPERKMALAYRWIIAAAKSKKGQPMYMKLSDEIMTADKNEGEAVRKRENVHKMAEANRALAHFAQAKKKTV